ncbi:pyrroline-5-carboxylate reductase [Pseudanabaena sp. FACHB-1998]|uniref:pyrroline-5-carboxylate reductase n=1 Tax=Pseudanabaena sp. FACHB-1998 TaxID=2692858 RepID=UPI001680E0A1|nr:pyrroline-5-carboxylate reductase [Pseudanabaena sp. FACHB-1998]MBD2178993.1 pyrroline-5-carboxylate reductase [Pseudanabaena sp. FACHB-1998]
MKVQLGIVGGGVMGEAILSRLIASNIYQPSDVCVSDPMPERRETLAKKYGVQVTPNNLVAAEAEIMLLAVKPQSLNVAAIGLANAPAPCVVSILAGVTLAQLETMFPDKAIIRAMPNTPAQVGAGVTAISPNSLVTPDYLEAVKRIFGAIGTVVEVAESLMNAVTGLSGSGPAYVALVVEAMADGGVAAGLPRAIAMQLATQTVLGTAQLLTETKLHPAQLKDQVTSPAGTTIAAIAQLEKAGLRSAMIEAVLAATRRADELGK